MLPLTKLTIDELNDALTKKSRRQQQKEDTVDAKEKDPFGKLQKRRSVGKRPTNQKRAEGWNSLLSEISESSRRINVAKGGHFTVKSEMKMDAPDDGLEPETSMPVLPVSADLQRESKPPTAASALSQERGMSAVPETPRSADPKMDTDMDGEEGEAVWRSYRCDENVVTDEALNILWRRAVDPKHFTSEVPPLQKLARMSVDKRSVEALPVVHDIGYWRQLKKRRREQRKQAEEAETFPPLNSMIVNIFGEQSLPEAPWLPKAREALARRVLHDMEETEMQFDEMMEVVNTTDAIERTDANPEQVALDKIGVSGEGRRNGMDKGWQTEPLVELRQAKRRQARESQMSAALARSKESQIGESMEVKIASARVREAAEHKVQRLEVKFLQKKAQLSARLQRRVERLRKDHEETHDTKVNSILPSVVASATSRNSVNKVEPQPKAKSRRADSVLSFLKYHRHVAEKERLSHHSIYLQQVESFQTFLKRISDPNRAPDRGEAYLSESFRYVLSAGMVVDEHYFFRVLQFLQDSDFESTPTVNMLAACCASFDIDVNRYATYLRSKEIPMFVPRARSNLSRPWEDWEVWNGVKIEKKPEDHEFLEDGIEYQEDPLPFGPIVAEETPSASEALSRGDNDALTQLLQQVTLDAPLERYVIQPQPREPEDDGTGQHAVADESQALGSSLQKDDFRSQIKKPGRSLVKQQYASGKGTMAATRGVAEPIGGRAPQRPEGEKRRSARQPPMESIVERPHLERAS